MFKCYRLRKIMIPISVMQFLQSLDLDTAMFEALVQDRADFVQLFVDSGVNFKKFLTVRRLRDLYDKVKQNFLFASVRVTFT